MEKKNGFEDSSEIEYEENFTLALSDSEIDEIEKDLTNGNLHGESEK